MDPKLPIEFSARNSFINNILSLPPEAIKWVLTSFGKSPMLHVKIVNMEDKKEIQPPHEKMRPHKAFVEKHKASLKERMIDLSAKGLVITGTTFALFGIADFISGGKASEALSAISPDQAPEIVAWTANHLADMPLIMKTGGGSSMIATGALLGEIKRKK